MLELDKLTPEFVERVLGDDTLLASWDGKTIESARPGLMAAAQQSLELLKVLREAKSFRALMETALLHLRIALDSGEGEKLAWAIMTSQVVAIQLGMKL